jgi:hypothetical protein
VCGGQSDATFRRKGKIVAKSKESLPAVTTATQFEALEKEVGRVGEQAESRTRGIRIVSANGRFAAHVRCDRFSAQFDGNDFAIELHE